jgi:adenine-specific DNA-methyltransferase
MSDLANKTKEGPPTKEGSKLVHRRPARAELVWEGKYDAAGRRVAPLRVALPFQTVETVNESAQDRQKGFQFGAGFREEAWRNRLIWGDKKYVLPSLLPEFAGKVNLIYIDPPFDTGADFSFTATVPDGPESEDHDPFTFTKEPSLIEHKAYRDIWGGAQSHLDAYLKWFYETIVILHELLREDGSIYVHLDWHGGHYAKIILDEVFGQENFLNEIVWWYYNKFQGNVNRFASDHDVIFWYRKGEKFTFVPRKEEREKPVQQIKRAWDKEKGRIVNVKGEDGKVVYQESTHRTVDDVWRISMLQPADRTENLFYPTQKPEALLERVVGASSREEELVLDCFCGSGTTAAVAEKLNRRWIACDLGRFAIHTTRKRLLSNPDVRPFIVQNLGKYERQIWAGAEFGDNQAAKRQRAYIEFIVKLAQAAQLNGYTWLHGVKAGRMLHVGAVDAPVSVGDVTQIAAEFKRAIGTGKDAPKTNGVDVLGWDFAFEVNEVAKQQAAAANIQMRFLRIPRDVMDKRAVEQGDIHFFELAALSVDVKINKRNVFLKLKDFVIPPDDVPEDARKAVKHWSQWIDYWAVDWDNRSDAFHNEWQTYRTRKDKSLQLETTHPYADSGEYTIVVKVIDILGNDTTKTVRVKVA